MGSIPMQKSKSGYHKMGVLKTIGIAFSIMLMESYSTMESANA